jgi:hypothetical protein
LKSILLTRLEALFDYDGRLESTGARANFISPQLVSIGRLATAAASEERFMIAGSIYRSDEAFSVSKLVEELIVGESVPFLPVLRYSKIGLRKRREWEQTWALQRQEDAIDARTKLPEGHRNHHGHSEADELKASQLGKMPSPPKYTIADYLRSDFSRLRGNLDVPMERWASFPYCEGEDGTLMVAWGGYDHVQLAQAISSHFVDVQERFGGRDDPRLLPLLACVLELIPWLKQWHNEIHLEYGMGMGDYFEGFIQEESRNLGLTLDEIRAWQPPQKVKAPGHKGAKKSAEREVEEI